MGSLGRRLTGRGELDVTMYEPWLKPQFGQFSLVILPERFVFIGAPLHPCPSLSYYFRMLAKNILPLLGPPMTRGAYSLCAVAGFSNKNYQCGHVTTDPMPRC